VIHLPRWPHPLLLAELIGHARAVVGISLHLAITAMAFGVPVFRPGGARGGKYAVLTGFDSVRHWPAEGDIDPRWFAAGVGQAPISPAVRAAVDCLSDHWDRLAFALSSPDQRPHALPALGEFWQSLPRLLEESSNRREGAIAAAHVPGAPE
jgi:lipopolysaccharide transport system ATP-binding protein